MFGFLFLNTVSKLKRKRVLKPSLHFCITFNKTSAMSLVVFFIFSLVYMLSVNHGVALSFAKKLPAFSATNQSFLYSTGSEIAIYTPSKLPQKLLYDLPEAIYLDVAPLTDEVIQIFWSQSKGSVIKYALMNNSGVFINSTKVVAKGMSSIAGIFVDVVGGNLFWLDRGYSRLEVSRFDGSLRTSLLLELTNASSLAGDSYAGLLFWSSVEIRGKPILERSFIDGSDRFTIYEAKKYSEETIDALCVNEESKKIFWIDKKSNIMHKANYDGSSREEVGQSKLLSSVISFNVLNGNLFWVEDDLSSGMLVQVNLENFDERRTLTLNRNFMYHAKIIPDFRPARALATDSCLRTGGRCSHLCLRGANGGTSCFCPYGLEMSTDDETCQDHGSVLAFATKNDGYFNMRVVKWNDTEKWIFPPMKIAVDNVNNLASDPERDEIYWIYNKNILKQSLVAGQSSLVLKLSYFEPKSLVFDWKSDSLYILSGVNDNNGVLSACKTSGHQFSHLIWENMYQPQEMAIDPVNRKLFWSHSKESDVERYSYIIENFELNGENRIIFFNSSEPLRSLVTDLPGKQLCWLNQNQVVCKRYSGNEVQTLNPVGSSRLTVLSSYDGFLMVANEMGILQTINISSNHKNFLYMNTSLAIRYVSVLAKTRLSANYSKNKPRSFEYLEKNSVLSGLASSPFLLYLSGSEPHSLSLNGENQPELLPYAFFDNLSFSSVLSNQTIDRVGFSNFEGVNTLYWVEAGHRINSIEMDGTGKRTVLELDYEIGGIACDSVLGNIYWTLPYEQKIMVTDHNQRFTSVLYNLMLTQPPKCYPTAITLHTHTGNLFFVICCDKKCGIHHTFKGQIWSLQETQTFIGDLVVEENYVYWTEPLAGAIRRINLHTQAVEMIVQSSLQQKLQPMSLSVFENSIYWTDGYLHNGSIVYKRIDYEEFEVTRKASQVWKLLLITDSKPSVSNPCRNDNGGCSHLCIYRTDTEERCYCSYSQLIDKTMCKSFASYLLIADTDKILTLDYQNISRPNPPLPNLKPSPVLEKIITLAYDYVKKRIYFSDLDRKPYIFSIFPNGTDLKPELRESERERHVEGMTYDLIIDSLFWTESFRPSIWSLKDQVETELFSLGRQDKPRGVAVHPCTSQIFWTNKNKIESGNLNGQNRKTIISEGLDSASALSIFENEIYWTNKKEAGFLEFYIEKSNLDGSNRLILISGEHRRPFALTPTKNFIFWTDREQNVLCQSSLEISSAKKSCDVVMRNLRNPFGVLIVRDQNIICEGNLTKVEERVYQTDSIDTISNNSNNTTTNEDEPGTVHSHSRTFKKLIISISVISIGALVIVVVLMFRRQKRRKRIPKCATIKQPPIGKKTVKQEGYDDCMFKTARNNPSFELDDVFCSDILEENGTLIDS